MTRNFKMVVSYDGTRYFGWEHQQETDLTIQGRLETVLTRMTGRDLGDPVTVIGAGRTDAGVHARAMTCNVLLDTEMTEQEIIIIVKESEKLLPVFRQQVRRKHTNILHYQLMQVLKM